MNQEILVCFRNIRVSLTLSEMSIFLPIVRHLLVLGKMAVARIGGDRRRVPDTLLTYHTPGRSSPRKYPFQNSFEILNLFFHFAEALLNLLLVFVVPIWWKCFIIVVEPPNSIFICGKFSTDRHLGLQKLLCRSLEKSKNLILLIL